MAHPCAIHSPSMCHPCASNRPRRIAPSDQPTRRNTLIGAPEIGPSRIGPPRRSPIRSAPLGSTLPERQPSHRPHSNQPPRKSFLGKTPRKGLHASTPLATPPRFSPLRIGLLDRAPRQLRRTGHLGSAFYKRPRTLSSQGPNGPRPHRLDLGIGTKPSIIPMLYHLDALPLRHSTPTLLSTLLQPLMDSASTALSAWNPSRHLTRCLGHGRSQCPSWRPRRCPTQCAALRHLDALPPKSPLGAALSDRTPEEGPIGTTPSARLPRCSPSPVGAPAGAPVGAPVGASVGAPLSAPSSRPSMPTSTLRRICQLSPQRPPRRSRLGALDSALLIDPLGFALWLGPLGSVTLEWSPRIDTLPD